MKLTKQNIKILIDLVEIKLGCFEICGQADRSERANLERCLVELKALLSVETNGKAVIFQPRRRAARPSFQATAR